MPVGRPPEYSKQILEKAKEYRDNPLPEDEVIHTVEGLALYIGIARSTIYEWASQDDKTEFSDIVQEILAKQGKKLVNNGLSGKFNPKITAVMLSKHGYREGKEITGADGKDLFTPSPEEKEQANKALDQIG